MLRNFSCIALPTRPQPDTIVAIYILQQYGSSLLPGIKKCSYTILSQLESGKTANDYMKEGTILIDVGGGIFDHHGKTVQTTASLLVAEALGIQAEKSIQKLLAYAKRDDFFGKGTQSNDPLDKAFGLSGLIAALNKTHSTDITFVIETVLPLIAAHHIQENQRYHVIPLEVVDLKQSKKFIEAQAVQKKNVLRICFVESDNVQLPGYLRATDGGKFDVVVQKRSIGHVNILTKPLKRPDLRKLAEYIRNEEYIVRNGIPFSNLSELRNPGRNDSVLEWYFDPATNSLQNGGINPGGTESTHIPWENIKALVIKGMTEKE